LFHPRTFFPLMETGVPMLIRNTMDPAAPGTLISSGGAAAAAAAVVAAATGAGAGTAAGVDRGGSVSPIGGLELQPTCITSLEQLAMVQLVSLRQQGCANLHLRKRLAECLADLGSTVCVPLFGWSAACIF
jgi:aspartokinase